MTLRDACSVRKQLVCSQLSQLRKDAGYKQTYVARRIGVAESTLSGYEIGKNAPPLEVLVRLADLYNVSLDTLFVRSTKFKDL